LSPSALKMTSTLTSETERELQKWYLIRENKRPEIYVSDAQTSNQVIAAMWRSVLISVRILDGDLQQLDYVSLTVFPQFNSAAGENTVPILQSLASEVLSTVLTPTLPADTPPITTSMDLFQPDIARSVKVFEFNGLLCLALESYRTKSKDLNFEDLNTYDLDPKDGPPAELLTNDIPSFPFPTVFDFISEINRPADPATMSQLKYKFKIQDLKYDLTKMAKKKNPQEVVDSINCKLTRLKNWRDVLSNYYPSTPNPLLDLSDWADNVMEKFETLKYFVKTDPKKALDLQYDKKKVFIKIIDQWSDRLKRNFKYIYQSQRKQEDYKSLILNSTWRKDFLALTSVFNAAPFLSFESLPQSQFTAGQPSFTFRSDKKDYLDVWGADMDLTGPVREMYAWMDRMQRLQQYAYGEGTRGRLWLPLSDISLQVYSKGYIAERVLYDLWTSLAAWLDTPPSPAAAPVTSLASPPAPAPAGAALSHHSSFLQAVQQINRFSRSESASNLRSVRDLYQGWSTRAGEVTDWLTNLVSEKNIDQDLDKRCSEGGLGVWSAAIDQVLVEDQQVEGDEQDQLQAELDQRLWSSSYRPLVHTAELLQSQLVGMAAGEGQPGPLKERVKLRPLLEDSELFLVDPPAEAATSSPSMLFVLPRYFRDIGMGDDELNSFLDLCKEVAQQLSLCSGATLSLTPLHPQMINQKGQPDFSRRAPYPAILLTYHPKPPSP